MRHEQVPLNYRGRMGIATGRSSLTDPCRRLFAILDGCIVSRMLDANTEAVIVRYFLALYIRPRFLFIQVTSIAS